MKKQQKLEKKEILDMVYADIYRMLRRLGHQIKIHRTWLLKQDEESIIKWVIFFAWQIHKELNILKWRDFKNLCLKK